MLFDDIYVTKEFMIQIFRFSYVKSFKESDLSSNSFPDTSWLVSPYDLNEQVVWQANTQYPEAHTALCLATWLSVVWWWMFHASAA